MKFGLQQRDLTEIILALKQYAAIEEAIIFGSRAKGNYKKGSDVDIALKGEKLDYQMISALSFYLNEESSLPYFFDVVHFEEISEKRLTEHINRVGRLLYSRNDNQSETT
jgi:predicted nucleotidyltransferase